MTIQSIVACIKANEAEKMTMVGRKFLAAAKKVEASQ